MDDFGADDIREGADRGVIVLHRRIIFFACPRNAILGAFDLDLGRFDVLGRDEVRILLDRNEQTAQRATILVLRLLILLDFRGIFQVLACQLD